MNNNLVCVCVVLCNEQHRYIRLCHIVMHTNNICVCRAKRTSHSESFGKIALIFDLAPINSQGSSNKILGDKNTCISKIVEWKDHNTEENKQEKNERSKRAARAALTKLAADQSREREREQRRETNPNRQGWKWVRFMALANSMLAIHVPNIRIKELNVKKVHTHTAASWYSSVQHWVAPRHKWALQSEPHGFQYPLERMKRTPPPPPTLCDCIAEFHHQSAPVSVSYNSMLDKPRLTWTAFDAK